VGKITKSYILDFENALHLSAVSTFIDENEVKRKAGTQWLVQMGEGDNVYFPGIHENVVSTVKLTILSNSEYCTILDPFDVKLGKSQLGANKLVKGPAHFFLQPGEKIKGIQKAVVLTRRQGVWLTAKEEFVSDDGVLRKPGSQWFVAGPRLFYPPLEITHELHHAYVSMNYPFKIVIFRIHYLIFSLALILLFLWKLFSAIRNS